MIASRRRPRDLPGSPVSRDLKAPRYHQVYVALRDWITGGRFAPGSRIPSEAELCVAFQVSRITVRRAIDELVGERLLVRRQGSGTFVPDRIPGQTVALDFREITTRVANLGRTTEVVDLKVEWLPADATTAGALQLAPGARVHKSSRVRTRGRQRLGWVTTWLPEDIGKRLAGRELRRRTVLELIERAGISIDSAEQSIGASLAGIDVARALGVAVGVPLVRIERIVRDTESRPIERVEAFWRADCYEYRMRLRRERRGRLSGWIPD